MIDIHLHFLPGVDDGPETLEESVELCQLAAEDGCEALVATPHQGHARWTNDQPDELRSLLETVKKAVGPQPRLYLGGEIRVGSELNDAVDDPRRSGFVPLAGSKYLLLELPRNGTVGDPEALTHELHISGWRPIFAHPEFIQGLANDLLLMRRMAEAGALFQVTAGGLTGALGRRIRRSMTEMIDLDLVHFVASDAHGAEWRPPGLGPARRVLADRWGEDTAHALTYSNPLAVLENRHLPNLSTNENPIHALL